MIVYCLPFTGRARSVVNEFCMAGQMCYISVYYSELIQPGQTCSSYLILSRNATDEGLIGAAKITLCGGAVAALSQQARPQLHSEDSKHKEDEEH